MLNKRGRILLLMMALLATWMNKESSFVDATAEVKEKKESSVENVDKKDSADESVEESREKKSREEIMFGNQQKNKHNYLESMLGMSLSPDLMKTMEESSNNTAIGELLCGALRTCVEEREREAGKKLQDALKDESKEEVVKEPTAPENEDKTAAEDFPPEGTWYNKDPVSGEALQYLLNNAPMQSMQSMPTEEDMNTVYDQDEVYRRKRQLAVPLSLRKRSLRSPLGQMIQSRGRRLQRRSMRFKRQVDLDELLSILGDNEADNGRRYFEDQERSEQSPVHHRESNFRYPYNFGRNEAEMEQEDNGDDNDGKEELPNNLLYSPPGNYYETQEYPSSFSRSSKQEEGENPTIPYGEWMEQSIPQPSIFTVNRRSSPLFYPLDYRYIPGYKKKRSMMGKNDEANFGKWGRVVQTPNTHATAEDVARLYALANMLAEGEIPEKRIRRSA